MTKDLKKVSKDVVGDDGKTVDQTIISSMEIRSRSVGRSSGDAGEMVVTGSMPLLGLELTGVENKGENLVTSNCDNAPSQMFLVCSPLLGTSTFQTTVIVDKSLQRRSQNSVCYESLLRDLRSTVTQRSNKTAGNDDLNCYGKLLQELPRGVL